MGFRAVGPYAASGLLLFFIGAMTAHGRARTFHNIAFPATYLALAIASLKLSIDHERGAADNTRPDARIPSVAGNFG
jgi:DoxX-like family